MLGEGAPRVAWVLYPATDESWGAVKETSDDPARYAAFYEIERQVAAQFPGRASTIDLAGVERRAGPDQRPRGAPGRRALHPT